MALREIYSCGLKAILLTWAIFQDRGYFFRRKDLLKSKHRGLAISFFIDIIILLLILSVPVALWKIAHVIPLFKNGDKSLPSNYRPVSLLSCVSKIFEINVFKNIFNHLHKNKLLYKFQSGTPVIKIW
jgi:hypothetical protein